MANACWELVRDSGLQGANVAVENGSDADNLTNMLEQESGS
jgi:hypothetical protein